MTDALRIDIPVARAIVAHHGRARGLEVIAGLANPTDHDVHEAAYEALGSKVERREPEDGHVTIESVFALHRTVDPGTGETDYRRIVFWDNGGVVMIGSTIPETTAIALEGRTVDHIFDHPCIAGLIATTIDASPSDDGGAQLVIDLAAHTCALDDVANHIAGI